MLAGNVTDVARVPLLQAGAVGAPATAGVMVNVQLVAPVTTPRKVTLPPRLDTELDDAENEEMVGAGTLPS